MQNIVQSYLFRHYEVYTSEVGNDGIYLIDDPKPKNKRAPVYGDKLLKELITIFCLEEDVIKTWVEEWAVSIKPDVDLEFYWCVNSSIFDFPIARQVAARTIGLDLVSVEPMSGPTGQLMYMDFQYSGNTEPIQEVEHQDTNIAGRIWDNIMELIENQNNFRLED